MTAAGAGALDLLDEAVDLLARHDEQDRPEEAGDSWRRCRDVLLGARDLLEDQGARADPAALARARFLLGLTLSVGYWQAVAGHADAYGVQDPQDLRDRAAPLLALARATLPGDTEEYATACVRLGLLLHARYEDAPPSEEPAEDPARAGSGRGPGAGQGREAGADGPVDPDPGGVRGDDLDEALAAFGDGLPLLGDDVHPGLLVSHGCALADRYDRDRAPGDLRDAATALEALLADLRPSGWEPAADGGGSFADEADEIETEARVRLARLFLDHSGTPEHAHPHLELLAATLPEEHGSRIFAAAHLVDVYRERGDGRVAPGDRTAYLARLRDLYRLLDPASPHHAQATSMLGAALAERDESAGPGTAPTAENEEAVGLLREALDTLPEDDARRPPTHAVLGCLLNSLRERHPERYDNDEALRHLERAVELYPADDPMRSDLLNQLAHAAIVRDDRGRADLEGVDRTIALLNESMRVPSHSPGFGSQAHGAYAAALSQRHALSNSADDLDGAIRHLTMAFRQTALDDVNRVVYLQNLAVSLYQRYQTGGDLQDLETAVRYMQEVGAVLDGGDTGAPIDLYLIERDRPHLEHGLAQLQFMFAVASRSGPGTAAAVESMRRLRDSFAEDDPERLTVDADFGLMLMVWSFHGGSVRDRMEGLVLLSETVDALPEDHPERPRLLLRTAGALLMTSFSPYNGRGVESAARMLGDVLDAVPPDSQEGLRAAALTAMLHHGRFLHGRVPADADRAVEVARAARDLLADRPPSPVGAQLTNVLADSLRLRSAPGDAADGRRTGIAGLREAATVVLLQAAAEPALQVARSAADRALHIARWCLADGDLAAAVEALELGRGQVLHASTTTADVPALLREAGRADLAQEWEGGGSRGAPAPIDLAALLDGPGSLLGSLGEGAEIPLPDDLRRRTLTALARSRAGTALMTPPTVDEIAAALRTAGAHALVYLLPPGGDNAGTAVLVTRESRVDTVEFGLLRRDGLDVQSAYRAAHRSRQEALDTSTDPDVHRAAHARWRAALTELCDWAGPVVMAPLLRSPLVRAAGSEPHLVLVPFGDLGGIPWHAALLSSGLRDGGRPVRALERLTLSYAASARQLHEVLGRPRLPFDARPVIVGNPDGTLPGATTEARQIHAAFYPSGRLLGKVRRAAGPGTPAEVLAALPAAAGTGASVLHLACHARPSGTSPLDACLLLAAPPDGGPGRLPVREILRQARGRPPGAPGGLVVLDACVSDHTTGDFDESLTLSTAFLAAGATGVVGSRWEVPDGLTGLMMYVFHDRLRTGATPVQALRQAQLWLLDPDRTVSGDMPRTVADILHDGDPSALEMWAAFACQGH
ncbi:CHAT domain-containing protein [Streptomyces sp. NPDC093223]|uniref:CHAT domain-containing protein n=1 Tax=Streptomyces sp. NPDC093223 TaxID=3366033 RepID=UPI0038079E45